MSSHQGELIITVNAGSSSIKMGLFRGLEGSDQPISFAHAHFDGIGTMPRLQIWSQDGSLVKEEHYDVAHIQKRSAAFELFFPTVLAQLDGEKPALMSHRIVHGGSNFKKPVHINAQYIEDIRALTSLAPLHQTYNLAPIEAQFKANPDLFQVACFDTSFHANRSEISMLTGLPYHFYEEGIKRYGVHGLSFEYICQKLQSIAPQTAQGRIIIAHLGSGVGICATLKGQSIEVSTSFTALDGAPMGTRCGSLDPGVMLHLMSQGKTHTQLEQILYRESGLLGISGISNDMRKLKESTQPRAQLARDYFAYHLAQQIGRLAVTIGGIDGLVFTAGIGEKDSALRAQVIKYLEPIFNSHIDAQANDRHAIHIASPKSAHPIWVIPTDEESMLAKHAWKIYCAHKSTSA